MGEPSREEIDGKLRRRYGLSARQSRVAVELAEGKSYKEIAAELGVTFHTVNAHVKSILEKTGAGSSRRLSALIRDLERE